MKLYGQGACAFKTDTIGWIENMDESPIMRYFEYSHLPNNLQHVSRPFHVLAWVIERDLKSGPEKSVALRKLLESKDAAVRAAL